MVKPRTAGRGALLGRDPLDVRERRRFRLEPPQEGGDGVRRPLDLGHHAVLVVAHRAGEPELGGQPEDERAEADALHGALHPHRHAPGRGDPAHGRSISSRSTCYAVAWASWMRGMCSERVTTTWSASRSAATRPPS